MTCFVEPQQALQNPRRARLYAQVLSQPGIGFRGLVAATGIPAGTAQHHTGVLRRSGLIHCERMGHVLRHYPASLPAQARMLGVLERTGLAQVYRYVAIHGPVHQKTILDALDAPRSTTQHQLQRLQAYGFVCVERRGRRKVYTARSVPA